MKKNFLIVFGVEVSIFIVLGILMSIVGAYSLLEMILGLPIIMIVSAPKALLAAYLIKRFN
jgi:hypothetical protein